MVELGKACVLTSAEAIVERQKPRLFSRYVARTTTTTTTLRDHCCTIINHDNEERGRRVNLSRFCETAFRLH